MLVTHQLQYLKGSEHIVIMNAGQVKAQGTYSYIKNNENELKSFYDFKNSHDNDYGEGSKDGNEINGDVS